jgi:RNA polymerase sigma-70 factor (ECF subfamily)
MPRRETSSVSDGGAEEASQRLRRDAGLAARIARGERQALEESYRAEAGPVYRYALGLCGNAGWAADATQDAFVALATQARAFDASRGSLGAWLAGVARHALLAQWRRESAQTPWPPLDFEDGESQEVAPPAGAVDVTESPEALLVRAQSGARVLAALHQLSFAQREAIVLVDLQERSYEEAARIAGIELNTLRTRLHRARLRLAQELQGEAP